MSFLSSNPPVVPYSLGTKRQLCSKAHIQCGFIFCYTESPLTPVHSAAAACSSSQYLRGNHHQFESSVTSTHTVLQWHALYPLPQTWRIPPTHPLILSPPVSRKLSWPPPGRISHCVLHSMIHQQEVLDLWRLLGPENVRQNQIQLEWD